MKRRETIRLAGGAAVVSSLRPIAGWAQTPALRTIGFLSSLPEAAVRGQVAAFLRGLADSGHVPGRTVAIEYRWADGQYDRLPAMAAELVNLRVAAIVASGGDVAAVAAKAATATIPIVFTAVSNPMESKLVASLNRPGGNVTGVSILTQELDAKRLELLAELVPSARTLGALINPRNPVTDVQRQRLLSAAATVGRPLLIVEANTEQELDAAFATLAAQRVGAVVVGADPFFTGQRTRIVALAAQHALPAIYQWRQFTESGGLISYGPDFSEAYRQAGVLTGRVLRGEKPADLPVLQPTKFEMAINRGTAKALGLPVPDIFIARADEVIE